MPAGWLRTSSPPENPHPSPRGGGSPEGCGFIGRGHGGATRHHVASPAMPEDDLDPAASTQQFQAFVDRPETEDSGSRSMRAALVGAAVAGLVIVLALVWLVLG